VVSRTIFWQWSSGLAPAEMPLNTRQADLDEAPLLDGDERFLGVQMRGHPAGLGPGWVASAINCRFREGVMESRLGSVKPAWLNQISGTSVRAWDSMQGRGAYRDATGRQWTLVAVNGQVRAILPHNAPRTVPLPAGVTLVGGEQFLQFGTAVLLLRGTEGETLQLTDLAVGFQPVPAPVVPGLNAIPTARRGAVAGDRVWLVTTGNQIWASDLLDHTSYHPLNQFSVGDGAEELVTVALFGQTSLIVFLRRTVYRLTDVLNADAQGLLTNTTAPRVTARYGCIAADSVVDVGTDLLWLCEEGIASLTLTEQGEVQSGVGPNRPPMFSDPIHPMIQRIRWDYAGNAQGTFWDGKLYMAVPIDEAEVLGYERFSVGHFMYFGATIQVQPITIGRRYRWIQGDNQVSLTNGSQTLTQSGEFVASNTSVTLAMSGFSPGTMVGSLKEVYRGVNNAVLVYDFKALQPGWQGYDEAAGLLFPQYWFRRDYNGKERLFFVAGDGWGTLYEEGYEDAIGQPYVDVIVSTEPVAGNTVQVNGGTLVTADAFSPSANSGSNWGRGMSYGAGGALWADEPGDGGYNQAETNHWAAPNTVPVYLPATNPAYAKGVRFFSTTGQRPTVTTTGAWSTVNVYQWQDIRIELISRGYGTPARLERKSALKLQVLCETWNPAYSVALRSDGISEETTFVAAQTRSRTRYDRPFDRAAWNPANTADDFTAPYRQDYSLNLSTAFKLGQGLGVGLHQAAEHTIAVAGRARAHQIRINNTTGRLRLVGLGYEGRRRERGQGIKV
jgi:hypothetical protein